jgi:hypothetical protein
MPGAVMLRGLGRGPLGATLVFQHCLRRSAAWGYRFDYIGSVFTPILPALSMRCSRIGTLLLLMYSSTAFRAPCH